MEKFRVVFIVTGLAVMVVLHVAAIIWAIFRARPSRRVAENAGEDEEERGVAAGLSAEEVSDLPCHEFREGAAGGGSDCAVCLEALRARDRCMGLPRCGHVFHAECVGSWLRKSRRCPVCRAEMVERRDKDSTSEAAESDANVEVITEDLKRLQMMHVQTRASLF